MIGTVLDALSAPAGAEDTRSHEQRYHDALAEAMRRLVAGGLVPDRAGQPAKVVAHVSLADLLDLDAGSVLLAEWIARVREQWAGARAAASVTPGDGAAWLDGDAAEGFACDAAITPVVTGEVRHRACWRTWSGCAWNWPGTAPATAAPAPPRPARPPAPAAGPPGMARRRPGPAAGPGRPPARRAGGAAAAPDTTGRPGRTGGPVPPTERGREALEKAVIGKAVDLLSGPGGLASFLRRRQLGARLGGPSLPLDVGYSDNVPAGIRNAVRLRDQHCRWSGGCLQPAAACEIHHVTPKARGGKTSVQDCILLCFFHHHVMIHRMGLDPGPAPRRHHHRLEPGPNRRSCTATAHPPAPGDTPAPTRALPVPRHRPSLKPADQGSPSSPAGSKPNPHRMTTPQGVVVQCSGLSWPSGMGLPTLRKHRYAAVHNP